MLRRLDLPIFLRLSRPLNLGIALLTFGVAAWVSARRDLFFISDYRFWLEAFLVLLTMASGYWVNDVYDFKIDRVNKPQRTYVGGRISRKKVLTGYFVAVFVVLGASWVLPGKFVIMNYGALFVLYLYARYFKRSAVVGNLLVGCLTAGVVVAAGLLYHLVVPLVWMAVFAFLVTVLREIVKDVEDIRGDLLFGLHTLPIQIGIRSTKWVLLGGYVLMLTACHLPYIVHWLLHQEVLTLYMGVSVLLVQVPLLYGIRLLHVAYRPRDFRAQSTLLKLVVLTGLGSCLVL